MVKGFPCWGDGGRETAGIFEILGWVFPFLRRGALGRGRLKGVNGKGRVISVQGVCVIGRLSRTPARAGDRKAFK